MGFVKNDDRFVQELTAGSNDDPRPGPNDTNRAIARIREENRKKRLQSLFNQNDLSIDQVVVAVGDKEIKEHIKALEADNDALDEELLEKMSPKELKDEIAKYKQEFDEVVADILKMKEENSSGIDVECENLAVMLKDILGHNAKMENDLITLTEELEKAKENESKLKEELHIVRNDAAIERQKSQAEDWNNLRNGKGAPTMAEMMKKSSKPAK